MHLSFEVYDKQGGLSSARLDSGSHYTNINAPTKLSMPSTVVYFYRAPGFRSSSSTFRRFAAICLRTSNEPKTVQILNEVILLTIVVGKEASEAPSAMHDIKALSLDPWSKGLRQCPSLLQPPARQLLGCAGSSDSFMLEKST